MKERVKAVLNNKKPAFWIVAGAVLVCAAVAVCFLTNPKQDGNIVSRGKGDNSENGGGNNISGQEEENLPQKPEIGLTDSTGVDLIDSVPEKHVAEWFARLDLPEGYAFSEYQNNIGWMGGFLILPQAYDVADAMEKLGADRGDADGLPPVEWQYSGMVSMIPAQNTDITYTDGFPNLSGIPLQNHSEIEYINVIG